MCRRKKHGTGGDNEKRRASERTLVAGGEVGGLGQLLVFLTEEAAVEGTKPAEQRLIEHAKQRSRTAPQPQNK
jgi:hypothetical protein